eukprot:CAMPEP_0113417996 /NCGR_PEP_ID=MMETSP0013_2-20120614/25960_1 /TAXON_ID=2843 ORGANISM="Skeletonema costatum, Strain 1716" /NCGR_SAMPLE_ID=MMETSP0013_2 /ASSEMBLY_ACC=CAM_ASM_000158 /LENGTH=615 /DNA_ID=CAMNT_0000305181 /DNA_START=64 /DNA_END=1907 /DNA_ORIENTATION=+ /assembly_acc=CAM_ASM_000158
MAFSFGATPAPAGGGGFSFGGGTPAPAPSGGLFGNNNTASTPAPAPTGGGLFGTPAPAPAAAGGTLFGGTPSAAAPATGGGLFGSTPAPATGGLFGAPSPAPATGGLFGSTPAPAPGSLFGAPQPAPAMQQPQYQPQYQQQPQQYQQPLSGNTPYAQLPDNAKRAIDGIYQLMMQHRRTLASVKTMAPALLNVDHDGVDNSNNMMMNSTSTMGGGLSPADAAAGSPRRTSSSNNNNKDPSSIPLPQQMIALHSQIQTLLQSAESNLIGAQQLKVRAGEATVQAKMHGAWPIENVAARRGVALSTVRGILGGGGNNANSQSGQSSSLSASGGNTPTTTTTATTGVSGGTPASSLNVSGMDNIDAIALQHIMDIRAAHVDRIEAMPSPYMWDVLRNFEQRVASVQRDVDAVRDRLTIAEEAERVQSMGGIGGGAGGNETALLLTNADNFNAMTSLMLYEGSEGAQAQLSKRLATLARSQNDMFLHIAEKAARAHERLDEVKSRYRRFCESTKGGYYDDPFIKADIEEVSREREMQQKIMEEQIATAPPPPVAAPQAAPAPSTSLFGASPAPAPGGLFGAPAPAPSGGLFGAPAPAPGGLFGSTPAPAPAGGSLFGAP